MIHLIKLSNYYCVCTISPIMISTMWVELQADDVFYSIICIYVSFTLLLIFFCIQYLSCKIKHYYSCITYRTIRIVTVLSPIAMIINKSLVACVILMLL